MLGNKLRPIGSIGIILIGFSGQAWAKDILCPGTEIKAKSEVCEYLASPPSLPASLSGQIRAEILQSLEWDKAELSEPLQLLATGPRLLSDLFNRNGWMKGKQSGEKIPLEDWFFRPQPKAFSELDLKTGFNRSHTFTEISEVCRYRGPKKGHGVQPGIKIWCGDQKLKVKFEEVRVQPLVHRIFWALGYGVNPCDYHPGLKIAFDEKIFDEFNDRKGLLIRINVGRKTLKKFTVKHHYDALDYLASAHLKNGAAIDLEALSAKIAAQDTSDIDYLITKPVQIQNEDVPGQTEIGPWSYNDFDHARSKSLRAVGILSAWLGLFDLRRGNNLLVLDKSEPAGIRFIFSDLGSGLGRSRYKLSPLDTNDDLTDFKDEVAKHGRIRGAQVNEANDAFIDATADDFAYGVKLISQFSADQLSDILSVTGYEGAEKNLLLEKLLSRRASLQEAF